MSREDEGERKGEKGGERRGREGGDGERREGKTPEREGKGYQAIYFFLCHDKPGGRHMPQGLWKVDKT